jgi:predicted outer membrane repeat protein
MTFHASDGPSLIAAVQAADGMAGSSVIALDQAGKYDLSTPLNITADLTIRGRPGAVLEPATGVSDRIINLTGAHTLTLQGLTLQGGHATGDGGAVDATSPGAALVIDGSLFINNTATGDGGAINVVDGASLRLTNVAVVNNSAGGSGGGVAFSAMSQAARVSVVGSWFGSNQAGTSTTSNGGGLLIDANSTGTGNATSPQQVTVKVSWSVFAANTAGNNGGGVWASDVSQLSLDNDFIAFNTSDAGAGGVGDSVVDLSGATFSFFNNTVAGNRVTGPGTSTTPDGGGVFFEFQNAAGSPTATGRVTADIEGNTISYNAVAGAGGGLFVRDGAASTRFTATLVGNTIVGNRADSVTLDPEGDAGEGGGLYLRASASSNRATVDWNALIGNNAALDGGGAYVRLDSGTASLGHDFIVANQAGRDGGGIELTGNIATSSGGGTVTVADDLVAVNSAIRNGGGVNVDVTAVANLNNDDVFWNSAGTAGGGVANEGGSVTLRRTRVTMNLAPTDPNLFGTFTDAGGNTVG